MYLGIFILLLNYATFIQCFERDLTINVDALREDCYFQSVKKGQVIEVDYQVIDGGHGELDITFRLIDSTSRIVIADYKKSENNHKVDAGYDGDYKFCFDNTHSGYNAKTVFFEIIIERGDDDDDDEWNSEEIQGLQPEESFDIKIQEIEEILNTVKNHITKVRHLQDLSKFSEARDRNLAEENFFKVNTFSMIQVAGMLIVGLIQVVMLKSLFDDTAAAHKIWKKLNQR